MSNYYDLLSEAMSLDETEYIHDNLRRAQDHFQAMLRVLFDRTQPINKLYDHIEEICCALDLRFPKEKKLQVTREKNTYFEYGVNLMKQSI